MKAVIISLLLSITLTGCGTVVTEPTPAPLASIIPMFDGASLRSATSSVSDTTNATLVLDQSNICMVSWTRRWWIADNHVFAGEWTEGASANRGLEVTAKIQMTSEQHRRILSALHWLENIKPGTHRVVFEDPDRKIALTGSPSYAVDYNSPSGRKILISDHAIGTIRPLIDELNAALPANAKIDWPLVHAAYHLKAIR